MYNFTKGDWHIKACGNWHITSQQRKGWGCGGGWMSFWVPLTFSKDTFVIIMQLQSYGSYAILHGDGDEVPPCVLLRIVIFQLPNYIM